MKDQHKITLGLDIGASSIKYGFGDCQRGLQHFAKLELRERTLVCLRESVRLILDECRRMLGGQAIRAIGIGTPGTLDLSSGHLVGVNPNLPFWVGHSPRELIPPEWQIPVFCDNDANLMSLGEAWLRGSDGILAGLTVGSGIGCGIVMNGKVYHGAHGWAAELGHITSFPGGAPCTCGRKGCCEAYASVDGLRRRILAAGIEGLPADRILSVPEIIDLAESVPAVSAILAEGKNALARAVSDLTVLLDPDTVVIGGGAMDGMIYPWDELVAEINSFLPALNSSKTKLERAREGNRAGVLGAVVLAGQR